MPDLETTPLDLPLRGVIGAGTTADPRLIIELWLPVPMDLGWRLLMCRRVQARGGFWQGVSGRVEASDLSLRAACLRELEEELGLTEAHITGMLDLEQSYDFASMRGDQFYRKRCFAVLLPEGTTPDSVTLSDEHDACRMMTFKEAIDVARFPEYVTELESLETRLHNDG